MPLIQGTPLNVPAFAQKSGNAVGLPSGFLNEFVFSELLPQYYSLVKLGLVFYTVASAINPAAFNGGAAGTPIVGLFNPSNSGLDLVILATRLAVRTTGTAAVAWDTNWWIGPSALPTGTRTNPFNMYSQNQTNSGAAAFVNTAMTGSTALLGGPIPVLSGGLPAATAVTNVVASNVDERGLLVIAPGTLAALGQAAALTAASMDCCAIWAELPA